jgi:hypothetical protein
LAKSRADFRLVAVVSFIVVTLLQAGGRLYDNDETTLFNAANSRQDDGYQFSLYRSSERT